MLFFCFPAFSQQDPQYSLYMFNQLALNPAYAGSRDVMSATLLYRSQWMNIDGAPVTAALAIQAPLRKNKMGLGLEIVSDKLGPKSTTAALASYAYRFNFLKGKLSFGLRLGFYNYTYDWGRMDAKDKNDIYFSNGSSTSALTGTGDFGMYYYTRKFYWGLGVNHLNRGPITDAGKSDSIRQEVHYFMPVGKAFERGNVVLNPSILIKAASNGSASMDINMNVLIKNRWWIGFSLRTKYGVVFVTQYQISEKLKAGYAYDYGINRIGVQGGGSHEIMIGYDFNMKGGTKITMPRYL